MFDGFILDAVTLGEATLRVRHGGFGEPLLLLHGRPRTHTTWHRVAPLLAREFHVVCPDLRGFGQSSRPPDLPDHAGSSKRAKAQGRTLQCPLLCLWSERDDLLELYGDVLEVWRAWAPDRRGQAIASGHHMAEEAPEAVAEALGRFFSVRS